MDAYLALYREKCEEFEDAPPEKPMTPARVRAALNKILQETNVKITEMQKLLGVSPATWGKFMKNEYKDKAWGATQSGTYWAGAKFCYAEKALGPRSLLKTRACGGGGGGGGAAAGGAASGGGGAAKPALPDLSGVEVDDTVFETPGEVRKSLRGALSTYKTSVAELARLAGVPYQSFNNFMKASGSHGGSENQAYRPAAALSEKLRVKTARGKTKKRKAIEAELAAQPGRKPFLGLDPNGKYWAMPGARFEKDAVGRHTITYGPL